MNKVAIAFSTKDRVELSKQSVEPLYNGQHALFWVDGSNTPEGEKLPLNYVTTNGGRFSNVRGGADAAIVFSLTRMLLHPSEYTHVGLVENDVLLHRDWFGPTMALFPRGTAEGLEVGAVSARCYEDRVLIQRDGYAVCHNLGAGMVIFTRHAAQIVLDSFRTGWWPENRRIFSQLCGVDIGRYAAFRANEQNVTADWHFDAVLAQKGLASLALVPSPVEMIGQIPPLHEQGLKIAVQPVELLRDDKAFAKFAENTKKIRENRLFVADRGGMPFHQAADGSWTVFPHQVAALGGRYEGEWRLKWSQGFGPFAYRAGNVEEYYAGHGNVGEQLPTLTISLSGACAFFVSGGEKGGRVKVEDKHSGYVVEPLLPPEGPNGQILNLPVPGGAVPREIVLTMLSPGTIFYGIVVRDPQARDPHFTFDHSMLPSP